MLSDSQYKGMQQQPQPVRHPPTQEHSSAKFIVIQGPVKITHKQMWFDLIANVTPPEEIDYQPTAVLVVL